MLQITVVLYKRHHAKKKNKFQFSVRDRLGQSCFSKGQWSTVIVGFQHVKLTMPAASQEHIARFHNAMAETVPLEAATIWPHSKWWGGNEFCNELLVTQKISGLQQKTNHCYEWPLCQRGRNQSNSC